MVVEDSMIWEKENPLKRSNNNNRDFTAFVQRSEGVDASENVEVDITERTNLDRIRYSLVESRCQDTTESSSSFEESISEVDDSDLCGDATSSVAFIRHNDILHTRRKKVTSQWRAYVKPLVWRSKWTELQLSRLKSLAQKYDKELAQYSDQKKFEFKNFESEDVNSKSVPLSFTRNRNKVLERKRRRRNEDKLDIADYMSKHNLFSFYENRKSAVDSAFQIDAQFNPVVFTEKLESSEELKAGEELVDRFNSDEQTLLKIQDLQSRVSRLKASLQKVMSENSKADDPSFHAPSNALNNSWQLNGLLTDNDHRIIEGTPIATQLLAEYTMDHLLPRYNGVWKYGERIGESTLVNTHVNTEYLLMKMKEQMRSFEEADQNGTENNESR